MELTEHKAKSLHEIEKYIHASIMLQIKAEDVAIPYLQGAPGCGKTAIINSWAKKYNWNLLSLHFALLPIEEISGIPLMKKITVGGVECSGTEWTLPGIVSALYEMDQSKPTIVFLDDFHLCSPDHLNLGFEMFTNRSIHGYKIPENCAFILAGNNSSKAGSKISNSAIINRCAVNPVFMDFDYWKKNYAFRCKLNNKILSFLSNEKNRKYFHMDEMINKPWASPRSWTRFSKILNELENFGEISYGDLVYYAESHVGPEAGTEFTSYYKLYRETEMDLVFVGKKDIEIPDDMTGQYIYVLAAFDELSKMIDDDKAFDMFALITSKVADKNISIATVGIYEICQAFGYAEYEKYKNALTNISEETANRITAEIALI
jgi:hypothetical protein